jgi:hypothetical protein
MFGDEATFEYHSQGYKYVGNSRCYEYFPEHWEITIHPPPYHMNGFGMIDTEGNYLWEDFVYSKIYYSEKIAYKVWNSRF